MAPNQKYVLGGFLLLCVLALVAYNHSVEAGMFALFISILVGVALIASFFWPPKG